MDSRHARRGSVPNMPRSRRPCVYSPDPRARHMDIVLGGRVIICGLRKHSYAFNVTVWSLTSGDWNDEAFLRYSMEFWQDARVLLQSSKTVCKTWELASWYQLVCETKCLQTILDLRRPSNFRRMKRPKNVKCPVNVDV